MTRIEPIDHRRASGRHASYSTNSPRGAERGLLTGAFNLVAGIGPSRIERSAP